LVWVFFLSLKKIKDGKLLFSVTWELVKNEKRKRKKVQQKFVPNNQHFSRKKVEIQNVVILQLNVGHHFNIDWNGNDGLSLMSGLVPNLYNATMMKEKYSRDKCAQTRIALCMKCVRTGIQQ